MSKSQPGETNPSAKLTETDVREIRRLHDGGVSLRELADDYDVSSFAVWCAVTRRTWAHVDPVPPSADHAEKNA